MKLLKKNGTDEVSPEALCALMMIITAVLGIVFLWGLVR